MARKARVIRGLVTGLSGARRVTRPNAKKKRSHRQKWTNIALIELGVAVAAFVAAAVLSSVVMLVIGSLATVASAFGVIESRSTPPDARHTVHNSQRNRSGGYRRDADRDARVTHGWHRVTPTDRLKQRLRGGFGGDRPRQLLGRRPCGAACQYSKKSAETCTCSCGGNMHGTKASVVVRKTRGPARKGKPAPKRKTPPKKPPQRG